MPEPMFAMWEDVEARVLAAAEGVLTDHMPEELGPSAAELEHAMKLARKITEATMFHLDGWTPADIAAEHSAQLTNEEAP